MNTMDENNINAQSHAISQPLIETMRSFYTVTRVPVTYFDKNGEAKWSHPDGGSICDCFPVYKSESSPCRINMHSAIKTASILGEPYIFVCKAGLIKIAVSLIDGGQPVGCFMAGPIIMGSLKESILSNMQSLNQMATTEWSKILLHLKSMSVMLPKDVTPLATVFEKCILGASGASTDYVSINRQQKELSRLSVNLREYKKRSVQSPYPYEIENTLINHIMSGDLSGTSQAFVTFFEESSVIESGDLSSIKTKVLSLCSILSRTAAEKAGLSQEEVENFFFGMDEINQAESLQSLSSLTESFLLRIAETFTISAYSGTSQLIHSAIQYVAVNYAQHLSLKDVAEALHASPPYLSALFKQETGVTFTEYLNQMRIRKSCELLSNTTLSFMEIATQCGFDDQSYFSKVFKKINGKTPSAYRKSGV